ncbi:ubiquitin carboxyl-terminal hydrolase 31-like isoform X2 [Ruditapes philippinarum]|nr:ubiquitin carboxyl-terminal hydrolase 31-like isoform X2 [Ruditapes philippinarum]
MTQLSSSVQLPIWDAPPGILGIQNHGNTCFMNTILQCLSSTDLFSEYFIQKKYKELFNGKGFTKRLVGASKCEVCEEVGRLLETLWSGSYTPEISSHFKNVVSKFNVQYKGSSQHDAQEFLLWLLDRLNDELHHSSKKKAKETLSKTKKEKNEVTVLTSPEVVLNACSGFDIYNKFQALYQSSLTCLDCKKQSNTYESYLCLSLPVPQKSTRPVYITVVYLDDSPKQLRIALEMNIMDSIRELRDKLAHELYVTPKRLVLCQLNEKGFGNTFGDDQPLSDIHESETIYVFETFPFSEVNKTPGSDLIQILIVHIEKFSATKSFRFCCPEVIKINRDIEFLQLQRCILKSMRFAVSERVLDQSNTYKGAKFDIRVVDSGPKDSYLADDVDMPLYTEPIDRALSIYNDDYGPTHIKFVIEWDPEMKKRLVDDDEDYVEEHPSVHKARLNQQQPSYVSLEECLKLFTKEEKLGDGDAWQCPNCEKTQEGATKKLGLWSAPDILVMHLKRFRHSGLRRNKLNILVNFPVSDLEMGHHLLIKDDTSQGKITSDLYDLYAVSNHYGNMSGGHYTAFCKNPVDMKWYEYDDTHVKPLQQRDIVSRAAYLLFYQRRKLTQQTIDSLQSQKHWVFSVYGPPRSMQSMQVVSSSPVEEAKSIVHSPSGGKIGIERDYSDLYVERVKLDVENNYRTVKQSRGKSEPPQDRYKQEEEMLLEELRQGINSPQVEHRRPVSSLRELEDQSPRREDMGINSPRQTVKHESPRKQLFPNRTQNLASQNQYVDEISSRTNGRNKITVAEQIVRSKQSDDRVDGSVPSPRNVKNIYRRSDSVDSSKNSHSFTSGSEISPTDSSPPSPLDDCSRTAAVLYQNQSSRNKSNILNNERDSVQLNGYVPKLKIHSNQIYKDSSGNMDGRRQNDNPPKTDNQKVVNSVSNNNNPPPRPDVFATPQQVRKSPSPPVVTGRGWSTPQPQRKQYSDNSNRPAIDRQFSVPPRVPLPQYESQRLEVEGHAILDKQPRSLPAEVRTSADKPPLPVKASHTAHRQSAINTAHDRMVPSRPVSAYVRGNEYSENRVPDYTDKPVSNVEYRSTALSTREPAYSDSRPVIIGERTEEQYKRGRSELDSRRSSNRGETRTRNRSADRHERRSMRVKAERPMSYHQVNTDDIHEQYYLSQPIDDTSNFERASRYATMQPIRQDYHIEQFAENDYLHRHTADPRILYHQPRSRAPINTYNPHLYQDHSSDFPRYQPHLQTAKMLTKMALQEKEIKMRQKMKSEYLKESSV